MNKAVLYTATILFFLVFTCRMQGQNTVLKQPVTVQWGDPVRLKVTGRPDIAGKYERSTRDSVAIRLWSNNNFITMSVPRDQIIAIDVPQKPRVTPLGKILIGTLAGASAGIIFGLVVPKSPTIDHGGFYYWSRGGTAMLWGAIGAGGGLIVGIGVAAATPQRWNPATIAGMSLDNKTYFTSISVGWRFRF